MYNTNILQNNFQSWLVNAYYILCNVNNLEIFHNMEWKTASVDLLNLGKVSMSNDQEAAPKLA